MSKTIKKNLIISLICLFTIVFTILAVSYLQKKFDKKYELVPFEITENNNLIKLNDIEYPDYSFKTKGIKEEYLDAINYFSVKVGKIIFNKNDNEVFSPISLYTALSMLTEGVSNELALDELTNVLGLNIDDVRKTLLKIYENNYYVNALGRTYMANSLWISDCFDVSEEYSKILKNNYFAESYQVKFSDLNVKNTIIDWINYYTEDMLNLDLTKYPIKDNTALMLINTIYFNNKWQVEFDEKLSYNDEFITKGDSSVIAKYMMHQINTEYKITEQYTIVKDIFENGNTITYVMPEDVGFVYSKKIMENMTEGKVDLRVPKIKISKSYNLDDALKTLGINQIFNDTNSLSKISDDLYVSNIKQDVGIDFSEEGVEAAAATTVTVNKTSLEPSIKTIVLNKPYYYCIKDSTGLILFIGYVNNPTYE